MIKNMSLFSDQLNLASMFWSESILTQYSTWMNNSPCCLHLGNRSDRKDMYLSRGHFLVLQGDESLLFRCNYHKALCLLSCKSRLRFIPVWAEGVANANVNNSFTWSCRTRLAKRRVPNSEESAISGGESASVAHFLLLHDLLSRSP